MPWITDGTATSWTTAAVTYTATSATTSTVFVSSGWSDTSTDVTWGYESPAQLQRRVEREQARCAKEQNAPCLAPAYKKAESWLREHLSTEQQQTFDRDYFFDVIGGDLGKRYRIRRGLSGVRNVQELKEQNGKLVPASTLCFHPGGDLPEGDILLTQKTLLENCETHVRRVANFS